MSPALAPGMHLTMVPGVTNFTFLIIELPITRVVFSVTYGGGVSPSGANVSLLNSTGVAASGENLFET